MSSPKIPESIRKYIETVSKAFTVQAKRLRNPSVLAAARDLVLLYFKTMKQLGTVEHEVALDTLKKQLKRSEEYAAASREKLKDRALELLNKRATPTEGPSASEMLDSINEALDAPDEDDPDMRTLLLDMRTTIFEIAKLEKEMRVDDGTADRLLLNFDARMHLRIFSRLALQRVVSFLGKHAFILLWSVVLLGLGYSLVISLGRTVLENVFNFGTLGMLTFLLGAAMFKEYFLSKWLKRKRIQFERHLLWPVVHHVFQANIFGLYSEVSSRSRNGAG